MMISLLGVLVVPGMQGEEPGSEESNCTRAFSGRKAFVSSSSWHLRRPPVVFVIYGACLGVSMCHIALICSLPPYAYILSLAGLKTPSGKQQLDCYLFVSSERGLR